jgi:hypothetical protein
MTTEQYDRWKDFALRMARACWPKRARSEYYPDAEWVEREVDAFFSEIDPLDICVISSWDGSDDYPEGHAYYRAETHQWGTRYASGPDIGDDMRDWQWEGRGELPVPKKLRDRLDRLRWSDRDDANEQEDAIWDEIVERWYGPVACCIRAGIDMACPDGHGMGVLGFTAGDLRRMYPEGVPEWVTGGDVKWMTHTRTGVIPGIGFTMAPPVENGTFAEMPDTAKVWL